MRPQAAVFKFFNIFYCGCYYYCPDQILLSTSLYPTKSCIYVHLFEGTEEKSAITVQETSHDSCFMQRPCNGQPRSSLTTVVPRVISEAPQDSSRSSAHLCCTAQQCSSHNNLRSALTTSPPDLTPSTVQCRVAPSTLHLFTSGQAGQQFGHQNIGRVSFQFLALTDKN